jgi:hypothetical protein
MTRRCHQILPQGVRAYVCVRVCTCICARGLCICVRRAISPCWVHSMRCVRVCAEDGGNAAPSDADAGGSTAGDEGTAARGGRTSVARLHL